MFTKLCHMSSNSLISACVSHPPSSQHSMPYQGYNEIYLPQRSHVQTLFIPYLLPAFSHRPIKPGTQCTLPAPADCMSSKSLTLACLSCSLQARNALCPIKLTMRHTCSKLRCFSRIKAVESTVFLPELSGRNHMEASKLEGAVKFRYVVLRASSTHMVKRAVRGLSMLYVAYTTSIPVFGSRWLRYPRRSPGGHPHGPPAGHRHRRCLW
jgi:hypothetical protein